MSRLKKEYTERIKERNEQWRREQQALIRERRAEERRRKREEKLKRINEEKTFKFDECVICLTEPSNILFCNCGHLCLCTKCNKAKSLGNCPICKTENTIKRTIGNQNIFLFTQKKGKYFIISYNAPMLGYVHHPPVYVFYHHYGITLFY